MTIRDARVTVVGGGVGGLTAALLLARVGARVTLIERVQEPHDVGAGLLLQPNGLAVLDGLSLAAGLERHGHALSGAVMRAPDDTRIVSATVPDFGAGLDHVLALRRSRLLTALQGAVNSFPAIEAGTAARLSPPTPTEVWTTGRTTAVLERCTPTWSSAPTAHTRSPAGPVTSVPL